VGDLWATKSEDIEFVQLVSKDFQPTCMRFWSTNVTDRCDRKIALCTIAHRAVKMWVLFVAESVTDTTVSHKDIGALKIADLHATHVSKSLEAIVNALMLLQDILCVQQEDASAAISYSFNSRRHKDHFQHTALSSWCLYSVVLFTVNYWGILWANVGRRLHDLPAFVCVHAMQIWMRWRHCHMQPL